MKFWLIGGTIVGLLGVSFYLAAVKRCDPMPIATIETVVVAVEVKKPAAPAPIVLQRVVDVADIEPLLDPPAIPFSEPAPTGPVITRVGYEEVIPNSTPSVEVKPIPRAKVDEVPMSAADREQLFTFWAGLFGGD